MNKSQLKTGRNVLIRDISIDDMDEINDITVISFEDGTPKSINGISKQRTAWLRSGLAGGDFDGWGKKANGAVPPDSVLKQLTGDERDELIALIQKEQIVNPIKPFKSN